MPLRILLILVLALVLRAVTHRAINRVVRRTVASSAHERLAERKPSRLALGHQLLASERRAQRAETIGAVLRSIATFAIVAVAFVTALGELNIQLGPIIASAGIAGVAIGFGAQNLVKDFLSGIFMILEDQYGVGDVIDAGEAVGTVEDVGLRVTRLRDANGVVWYVRNGEILRIGNKSQGWANAVVDVPIAYSEDVTTVRELIQSSADALAAEEGWEDKILEEPKVLGVEAMTGDTIVLRVLVRTEPQQQFDVARELRERLKSAFDAAGVKVPIPIRPYGAGPTPGTNPVP